MLLLIGFGNWHQGNIFQLKSFTYIAHTVSPCKGLRYNIPPGFGFLVFCLILRAECFSASTPARTVCISSSWVTGSLVELTQTNFTPCFPVTDMASTPISNRCSQGSSEAHGLKPGLLASNDEGGGAGECSPTQSSFDTQPSASSTSSSGCPPVSSSCLVGPGSLRRLNKTHRIKKNVSSCFFKDRGPTSYVLGPVLPAVNSQRSSLNRILKN